MYGTIFRMMILPGKEAALIALAANWNQNERHTVD